MDVPDKKVKLTLILSPISSEGGGIGEYAAKISAPGAVISGCVYHQHEN